MCMEVGWSSVCMEVGWSSMCMEVGWSSVCMEVGWGSVLLMSPPRWRHTHLAGCQHPCMKAKYILRHDQAVAVILETKKMERRADATLTTRLTTMDATLTTRLTTMDVGQAADLPEGIAGKRPRTLLAPRTQGG